MAETKKLHDPFLNTEVEISTRLVDRLRGKYANGPTMANGEPEFGWREFPTPPVQHEAAAEIERLQKQCEGLANAAIKNGQGLVLYERALNEIKDLSDSEDGEPLDDAIRIAEQALAF